MFAHALPTIALSLTLLLLGGTANMPAGTASALPAATPQPEIAAVDNGNTTSTLALFGPLDAIHPLVVALLQTLSSLFALLAFSAPSRAAWHWREKQ